ncbi:MAG: ABC transporter substrate-binding protein [Bifidobacteriaceae bacterium]|jgi:putative ABC transport system substrate-binding protein|nr:ABC transporter substrate-binding protein [Bifidobacteriaceae bacterium]
MRVRSLSIAFALVSALGLTLGGCSNGDGSGTDDAGSQATGDQTPGTTEGPASSDDSADEQDPSESLGPFHIGITQIVDHPSLNLIREGFKDALVQAGVEATYDEQNAQNDQSNAATIAGSFAADASIDLIVAIATPTAQAVVQQIADRPVLFAGVTDPVDAGLVPSFEPSGTNVTGTSDLNPNANPVGLIQEIVPDVKTVGVLYSSAEANSEVQVEAYRAEAEPLGIEIEAQAITNTSEVATGAQALEGVDAILIPTDNTVVAALEAVIQFAEQAKIPLFSADAESVDRGTVATRGISYYDVGLRTGEMAVQILRDGVDVGSIPTLVVEDTELKVNPAAADRMGISVPEAILADAIVVEEAAAE